MFFFRIVFGVFVLSLSLLYSRSPIVLANLQAKDATPVEVEKAKEILFSAMLNSQTHEPIPTDKLKRFNH